MSVISLHFKPLQINIMFKNTGLFFNAICFLNDVTASE